MASVILGRGGIILAEGLHVWGRQAVLLLNKILAFASQLRKSTENLSG
jgi:uracil DNA glycosylase